MGVALNLSLLAAGLSMLIGILGAFSLSDTSASAAEEAVAAGEIYTESNARNAGTMFAGMYTSMLDEVIANQRDPDYDRIETQRQELIDGAVWAADKLEVFAASFEGLLGELTLQNDDATSVSAP
jgi:hypothetical protein